MNEPKIIFCQCANSNIIPEETKKDVSSVLYDSPMNILFVPDLCGSTASKDPELTEFLKSDSITCVACHPRAVRWLFHAAGIPFPENGIDFLNMRTLSANAIIEAIRLKEKQHVPRISPSTMKNSNGWIPWFPVVDYDRCKGCRQCASFCLFGVYEVDEDDRVIVSNPANCKTNCPACARICPEAAIMFPKFDESPVNGDEIFDEESVKEKIKINVDEILGSDVYAALQERRNKARKRLIKKEVLEKAKQERAQYLMQGDS